MNAIEKMLINIDEIVQETNKSLQVIALIGDNERASSYLARDPKSQIDMLTSLMIKNPELMAIVEDSLRYANEALSKSPDLFPSEEEVANSIIDGYLFLKNHKNKTDHGK